MTDLSHDAPDDGFHEIQLSGKQLVFLFMATTVVSVVIFLCGVLVGRGVRGEVVFGAVVDDQHGVVAVHPRSRAPAVGGLNCVGCDTFVVDQAIAGLEFGPIQALGQCAVGSLGQPGRGIDESILEALFQSRHPPKLGFGPRTRILLIRHHQHSE